MSSLITRDGSGNYLYFTYNNKEVVFNLVFEDNRDLSRLQMIFEEMEKNYNLKVQFPNNLEGFSNTDYSNIS